MGDPAPGKLEADKAGWFVRDYFPEGVAPVSKILFDGTGTGTGIDFATSIFTTGIDMSSATISGDDIILSATGVISAETSITQEINGASLVALTASILQVNDNIALQFEGASADADGLKISCNGSGNGVIEDTAGTLEVKTSGSAKSITLTATGDIALNPAGADITIAGVTGGAAKLTIAGTGLTIFGGDTSADSLVLQGAAGVATEKITILSGTSVTVLGASVVLDGSVTVDGDHTFGTGTGAVSLNGSMTLATTKTYTSGASDAIGGTHIIYQDGAAAKSVEIVPGTKIDLNETNINLTGAIKLDGTVTFDDDGTIADATNVMTITQDTITLAGATKINLDGAVDLTGKLSLDAQGGEASVSGLLIGIGTSGTPATTDVTNANFVELRCETTATSGDDRLMYMRYYMNGINTTGGECLKAGTVLEKKIGTARGGQASIEVSDLGYVSGFACGWDALLEVANSAVPANGTYCAGQSQIYVTGASSDLSAAANHSIHRFSVLGGDATAEAKVLNAFSFGVANCVGNGKMIEEGTNLGNIKQSIRVLINGVVGYLLVYDAAA